MESLLCKIDDKKFADLKSAVKGMLDSYRAYNRTFLNNWHIQNSIIDGHGFHIRLSKARTILLVFTGNIYKASMEYELKVFSEAFGQ